MSGPKSETPNFCILRVKKLKTMGAASGSAQHTFREIPTPNADPARTHLNVTIGAKSSRAVWAAIKSRLPEKRRKDAVLCLEYLITASPEWWKTAPTKDQNEYLKAATRWLEDRHGKENIVCLNVQNDETSPHMVAYIVPKTKEGRLSAKEFIGGREKLRKMQTDFAQKVGKPVGLQRGVEGSKADHKSVKSYYAALNKNPELHPPPKPPAPSIVDRVSGKAKKDQEEHEEQMRQYGAEVEQARNAALTGRRAREHQARAVAKMRQRLVELEGEHEKAEELQKENKTLRMRLRAEEDKLAELVRWLMELILALLGINADLRQKVDAAKDEADELRAKIQPPVSQLVKLRKWGKD